MPEKFELHISDVRTFKSCRRRWEWSSPLKMHLEPEFTPIHFTVGKAVHFALANLYEKGEFPKDTFERYMNNTIAQHERDLGVLWPAERQQLDDAMTLGKGMLDNYMGWIHSFDEPDDRWKTVATEMKFEVPIRNPQGTPSNRIFLAGRLDGIIEDKETGDLWLREFKTAGREPNPRWLELDDQATTYVWAAQQILGKPLTGIQYRFLMKKVPERPRQLKNGTFSRAINSQLSTTYELYLDTLKLKAQDMAIEYMEKQIDEYGTIDRDSPEARTEFEAHFQKDFASLQSEYAPVLDELKMRGYGEYFKEFEVRKTQAELEAGARDLWTVGLEMVRPTTAIYTAPEWLKCVAKGQRVLMANRTWVPIEKIYIDDVVMGLEDGHLIPTRVVDTRFNGKRDVVRINMENGDGLVVTPDHKVMANSVKLQHPAGGQQRWIRAKNLKVDKSFMHYFKPTNDYTSTSFKAGWIQGYLDGDGYVRDDRINVVCIDQEPLLRIKQYAEDFGVTFRETLHTSKLSPSGTIPAMTLTRRDEIADLTEATFDDNTIDYANGYLAGMYDAEGHLDVQCRISQSSVVNADKCDQIATMFRRAGLEYNTFLGKDGMINFLTNVPKFLSQCPPATQRKYPDAYTLRALGETVVSSVVDAGVAEVYDLETECHSFVVEGYIVHNCQFCPFKAPCTLKNAGANWEQILRHEYRVRRDEDPTEDAMPFTPMPASSNGETK